MEKNEILCTNPSVLVQAQNKAVGLLGRFESTNPFPGLLGQVVKTVEGISTPWVSWPGQYSAECQSANGASWLQLTPAGGEKDKRPPLEEALGPLWGTHLEDVNAALGNLVANVKVQAGVYALLH
jgi:hypothetical protein